MSVISNKCQLSHQTFLLLCPFAIFILQFLKFSTIISVLRLPNSAGRNHKTRLNTIHFKPRWVNHHSCEKSLGFLKFSIRPPSMLIKGKGLGARESWVCFTSPVSHWEPWTNYIHWRFRFLHLNIDSTYCTELLERSNELAHVNYWVWFLANGNP